MIDAAAIAVFAVVATVSTPAMSPAAVATAPTVATAGASTLRTIDRTALQELVETTAAELMVPGALLLLRTPQGDFTATYGTTKLGTTNTPTTETQFRIASNTKTMTAALILLLAQDGRLSLQDPVSRYVVDVPNGDRITIADLLRMRSGLYNYTEAPELSAAMDRDLTRVWTPAELLALAFAHPVNAPPDTAYEYNNTNYVLLGLVVEKVGGQPLAQAMQERLFGPLAMRHTLLPASNDNRIPAPYAHGYGYGSSSTVLSDESPYPPEIVAQARAGALAPNDYTGLNHSFAGAAGGAISTADDLAVWIRALVGGKVLDAASQRRWLESLRPQDPNTPDGQQYGYGISLVSWGPNRVYFHGGETPGYNSKIAYDPTNQMTLVLWTSMAVALDGQQPANTLMVKVLDQIYQQSPLQSGP